MHNLCRGNTLISIIGQSQKATCAVKGITQSLYNNVLSLARILRTGVNHGATIPAPWVN